MILPPSTHRPPGSLAHIRRPIAALLLGLKIKGLPGSTLARRAAGCLPTATSLPVAISSQQQLPRAPNRDGVSPSDCPNYRSSVNCVGLITVDAVTVVLTGRGVVSPRRCALRPVLSRLIRQAVRIRIVLLIRGSRRSDKLFLLKPDRTVAV